jgi:superfamily I DNA/RNA helicase
MVQDHAWEEAKSTLGPDDAVICRNTAPLIGLAYSLIRAGVACKVEGRAIGDGLVALARRWKVKTVDALLNKLEAYRDREVQKAMAKGNDAKVEEVNDRVETVVQIAQACLLRGENRVEDVVRAIESMFADNVRGVLTLCTAHRCKGREWNRVFLWEYATRCPSRAARQPWQMQQEHNLMYVQLTRAKRTLVFVD